MIGRTCVLVVAGLSLVAAASAATPVKPADHHGYRWGPQRLLCTSVRKERRANDKVVITYKGKRYWCSKQPVVSSPASAAEAMGLAIAKRFNPAATNRWQIALPTCTESVMTKGRYLCSVDTDVLAASAAVVFPGGKVVFQTFECRGANVGRQGC